MKTEFQAYNALASQSKAMNDNSSLIAQAYARKQGALQAKAMQQRLASLSFAERLAMQIN